MKQIKGVSEENFIGKKRGTLRQPQECRGMAFKDLVKFSEVMLAKQV